jgi:hypothetical protein
MDVGDQIHVPEALSSDKGDYYKTNAPLISTRDQS